MTSLGRWVTWGKAVYIPPSSCLSSLLYRGEVPRRGGVGVLIRVLLSKHLGEVY